VQAAIGDKLATALLAGQIRDGQTVQVDLLPDRSALTVIPIGATVPAVPV
ncbi:MAG: hypothetical protein V7637_4686, partial [Mycobacteriales bacterium]